MNADGPRDIPAKGVDVEVRGHLHRSIETAVGQRLTHLRDRPFVQEQVHPRLLHVVRTSPRRVEEQDVLLQRAHKIHIRARAMETAHHSVKVEDRNVVFQHPKALVVLLDTHDAPKRTREAYGVASDASVGVSDTTGARDAFESA
eukprot:scaffold564_cov248-Pinguiococcus_pyrenoidosus.AAC.28